MAFGRGGHDATGAWSGQALPVGARQIERVVRRHPGPYRSHRALCCSLPISPGKNICHRLVEFKTQNSS